MPVNRPRPVQPKQQARNRIWTAKDEEPDYYPERYYPEPPGHYDEYVEAYYEPPYWYEPRPYTRQPYGYGPPPVGLVAPYY